MADLVFFGEALLHFFCFPGQTAFARRMIPSCRASGAAFSIWRHTLNKTTFPTELRLAPLGLLAGAFFLVSALPGSGRLGGLILALVLALAYVCALYWGLLPAAGSQTQWLWPGAAITAALLLLRLAGFGVETSDYTDFLAPWTARLQAAGGFAGLGQDIGNYNVPYMVLLALFSYFNYPPLYLIKLTSVLFDLLLAVSLCRIVLQLEGSGFRAFLAFVLALALPTVFLNGAVWGQCDSIYVGLGVLSLYLCLCGKPGWAMAAAGLSFAFKLQAVFLLPVFALFLLAGKLKWYHLPIFPAAYLLAVLPAVLAGRGLSDTLLFYFSTAQTAGSGLNYNSPSLYSLPYFYRLSDTAWAAKLGIAAAMTLCAAVLLLFALRRRHITDRSLTFAALLLTCGIPLLLPHMHERYFYFCDVLALLAACLLPRAAYLVPLTQFASLLGYHAYFYMRYLYPMRYGFCCLLITLLVAAWHCFTPLFQPHDPKELPYETPETNS